MKPGISDGESEADFTPKAIELLAASREEADRLHHNFVGTEHLLLGLIKLGSGTAFTVLVNMGVVLETVRLEIEKLVDPGPDQIKAGNIPGKFPYTPRVKKVLALAAREALEFDQARVGTEHILLGILCEGDGFAARVLKSLNINVEKTTREVIKVIRPNQNP
jgi:ATP-dependent Clp protease ATP-binding subunit ClpC